MKQKFAQTTPIVKYLTMFLLGVFFMIFTATAFNITPSIPNTIQYIKTIFLTSNGGNASSTGIILDGSGGTAWFSGDVTLNSLPSAVVLGTDGSGKIIYSTSGDVYNFISGFALIGPRGATGETGPQGIQGSTGANGADGFLPTGALGATPFWNGTSRTITNRNIYNLGDNVGIGTSNPGGKLQIDGSIIAGEVHNSIGANLPYSSILGGLTQSIPDTNYASIAGGHGNSITHGAEYSFIGGGKYNNIETSKYSSILGGSGNKIFGDKAIYGTIVGGISNTLNDINYSTIDGGGENSIVNGSYSTVLGGRKNSINSSYSVVAGYQAVAKHDNVFVRNSDTAVTFESVKGGDFLINVPGIRGVGINTNDPRFTLDVKGIINTTDNFSVGGHTGKTLDIIVKGSDGNNCTLNFAGGILIDDTCP